MFLFVLVMVVIAIIEVPKLLRQKSYGEVAAFGAMWLIAFVYGGLVVLRVELPSVMDVMHSIYSIIPGLIIIDGI